MTKREMELVKLFVSGLTVEDMYPQVEVVEVVEVVEETVIAKASVVEEDELIILQELKPMAQRIEEDFALFSVWYKDIHNEEPTLDDYYRERNILARQSR